MSHLLSHTAADRSAPLRVEGLARYQPLSLAGAAAAVQALVLGLLTMTLLVLLGWATAAFSGASPAEALRAAAHAWLLAHHTDLAVPGGALRAAPLGLLVLPASLLAVLAARASRAAGVESLRSAVSLVLAAAVPYALLAGVTALLSATEAVRPLPVSAVASAFVLAVTSSAVGVVRESRIGVAVLGRLPWSCLAVARGAVAGVLVLLGGGAALAAASLAAHHERHTALLGVLAPGATDAVPLVVLGALMVPNAALWAAAYALGPGFAVGAGTTVAPGGVVLGVVPVLPWLAALPAPGPAPAVSLVSLVLPLLAGVVVGAVVRRRTLCLTAESAAGRAALAGGVAGLVLGVLAWLAGGALGSGRMAVLGPSWWQVAVTAASSLALVAGITAGFLTSWQARRLARS